MDSDERGNGLFYSCAERFVFAWLVGLLGFVLACLIDLDHVIYLLQMGIPLSWKALATQAGRPAHVLGFYVSGAICLLALASLAGWVIEVLKEKANGDLD